MAKSDNPSAKSPEKKGKKGTSPHRPRGGFFRVFVKLFILAFLSAYAAAAFLIHRPADLSHISGYRAPGDPVGGNRGGDLVQRLSDAVATRLEPIALEEGEVNAYIAATLEGKQEGFSGKYVTFRGVWVDFSKNRCRIYMEREVFGRPSTMAIELKITREGDQFLTEFTSGQFGRLHVVQGFLLLVKNAYDRLATRVYPEELDLIFQMNQIKFEEDRLVLDPRFPKPPN